MAKLKHPKVLLEGRGEVALRENDHLATGGEGSVFRLGDLVVKIYADTGRMKAEGLTEKVRLLARVKHPYIVAPHGVVSTPSGEPVGLYYPFAQGEPLPRLFTNDYRAQVGFTDAHATTLVERMREAQQFVHGANAVVVDGNELNYLAHLQKQKSPEPRMIDVDSWAIGRWGAKVIMPSIRDWHTKGFTPLSDWFSWGIVTFQLFTGIHPYKGRLQGFEFGDLEGRMKANASVFSPKIALARAVRDFGCIPPALREWYRAEFHDGARSVPPDQFHAAGIAHAARTVRAVAVPHSGVLVYEKLFAHTDAIARVFPCGVVATAKGDLVEIASGRSLGQADPTSVEVTRVEYGFLVADWHQGPRLAFVDATSYQRSDLSFQVTASRFMRHENRLFVVTDRGLTEVVVKHFGKVVAGLGNTWGALPYGTRWYDGVGVQDTLGAFYLVLPAGDMGCVHVRTPELDGLTPLAAKAGERFVAVVALDHMGVYHKFEFAFDKTYTNYSLWRGETDVAELNMSVMPRGVCATITEDGEMVVFEPSTGVVKKVKDPHITTDMRLYRIDDRVVFARGAEVWSVRMS